MVEAEFGAVLEGGMLEAFDDIIYCGTMYLKIMWTIKYITALHFDKNVNFIYKKHSQNN